MPRSKQSETPKGRDRRDDANARAWSNVLADVPLFADLNGRHLKKVAGTGQIVRFHDRTSILRAGQPGDTLYVILDGEVSVRRPGLTTLKLGPGSFFGEMALLDGGERAATVDAQGPVTCLAITQSRFLKVLRDEPAIAIAVLKEVTARLRRAQAKP